MAARARVGQNMAVAVRSPYANSWDDGIFAGVRAISLYASEGINSIQFEYVDMSGRLVWGEPHGQPNGNLYEIVLDYDEYLCGLTIYGEDCVKSFTFETNRRTFGPFGTQKGTSSNSEYYSNKERFGSAIGYHSHSVVSHVETSQRTVGSDGTKTVRRSKFEGTSGGTGKVSCSNFAGNFVGFCGEADVVLESLKPHLG